MSLLGYLIPRIASSGEEPAATQALAYLLNASTDIAQAFVDTVGRSGIAAFTPGRIVAEEQHGDHFPDVTIRDADGAIRIFVENKFWAGLTDAQPVAYLDALPDDASDGPTIKRPAVKYERFVFDVFPRAASTVVVEADAEQEFAPLKNATGKDSADEVQRRMLDQATSWLRQAGVRLAPGTDVEIAPSYALDVHELRARLPRGSAIVSSQRLEAGDVGPHSKRRAA